MTGNTLHLSEDHVRNETWDIAKALQDLGADDAIPLGILASLNDGVRALLKTAQDAAARSVAETHTEGAAQAQ